MPISVALELEGLELRPLVRDLDLREGTHHRSLGVGICALRHPASWNKPPVEGQALCWQR
jgi:hypothetical protein